MKRLIAVALLLLPAAAFAQRTIHVVPIEVCAQEVARAKADGFLLSVNEVTGISHLIVEFGIGFYTTPDYKKARWLAAISCVANKGNFAAVRDMTLFSWGEALPVGNVTGGVIALYGNYYIGPARSFPMQSMAVCQGTFHEYYQRNAILAFSPTAAGGLIVRTAEDFKNLPDHDLKMALSMLSCTQTGVFLPLKEIDLADWGGVIYGRVVAGRAIIID